MIRVVLDTNIYISAFLFGGKPLRILRNVEDGRIALCYSPVIRTEVEGVLAEKFHWPAGMIELACVPFWKTGLKVKPKRIIHACVDPDDDRILECAVEAQAQFVVTGDKHLLQMVQFESIPILRPVDFLKSASL